MCRLVHRLYRDYWVKICRNEGRIRYQPWTGKYISTLFLRRGKYKNILEYSEYSRHIRILQFLEYIQGEVLIPLYCPLFGSYDYSTYFSKLMETLEVI